MLELTLVKCPHPDRDRELRRILENVEHRQELLRDIYLRSTSCTQRQRTLSIPFTVMRTKFLQELPMQLFDQNMKQVLVLNIWECESLRTLPAELGRLTSLRTLSIDDCRSLDALPAELGRLRYLTVLRIKNCPLLQALPRSLGNLMGLGTLRIEECCSLFALPVELGDLKQLRMQGLPGPQGPQGLQ